MRGGWVYECQCWSQMQRFGVDEPCLNRQPRVDWQVWLNLSVTSDFSLQIADELCTEATGLSVLLFWVLPSNS